MVCVNLIVSLRESKTCFNSIERQYGGFQLTWSDWVIQKVKKI
jgi:hypothetical protein